MTDDHIPTRPWPTVSIATLRADASKHRDWRLCVEAVAQGQQAADLLRRAPINGNKVETAQAALLKSFLMLTVSTSLRQAVAPMSALDAYKHLVQIAPQVSIYQVSIDTTVKPLNSHMSTAAYIAAHRDRHDQLLSADAEHHLSKPASFITDIVGGLPNTAHAHAIRELYAYLPDAHRTYQVANRLIAAVLRLPPNPPRNNNNKKSNQGAAGNASKDAKHYGRRPNDPNITDYRCMMHRMDNHAEGDDICKAIKARAAARAAQRPSEPAPAVAAVNAQDNIADRIALRLATILTGDMSPNVNNTSNYLARPLLDSCATHHMTSKRSRQSIQPFEKLSTDTAGPLTRTTRGNKYFTVLADQKTGWLAALPTPTKSASGPLLVNKLREIQRQSGLTVKRLHSDGAPELCAGAPKRYAEQNGIALTKAVPNAPQSNGQAERAIRTLKECVRTQLTAAKLPQHLWDYALADCVAKRNIMPTTGTLSSPHALIFGTKAPLPLQVPFGTRGFVPNRSRSMTSFTPRGISCKYLSPNSTDTVQVLQIPQKRVLEARAADFVPTIVTMQSIPSTEKTTETHTARRAATSMNSSLLSCHKPANFQDMLPEPAPPTKRELRPREQLRRPLRFQSPTNKPNESSLVDANKASSSTVDNEAAVSAVSIITSTPTKPPPDPRSLQQALASRFRQQWAEAHDGFIDKMVSLGAWTFVTTKPGDKPVQNTWKYRYKTDKNGCTSGVSARCTGRGDRMAASVHYDPLRTAAQSPSHTARRLLYAHAALHSEHMCGLDVPAAYPRAPADARYPVLMKQPRRADGSYTAPGKHVRIQCAQMGSPDGGFLWEAHRNAKLREWGWQQLQAEPGCFLFIDRANGDIARLLADTDDFVLTSKSALLLAKLKEKLSNEWQVTEQNPLEQHMGVAIQQTATGVKLTVRKHIEELLDSFWLADCNPATMPHDTKANLVARKPDEPALSHEDHRLYRHGVGLARFIADTVVYEIAYITAVLARALESPAQRHMEALKRLVRYLAGRRDASITYKHAADPVLRAYSDSDWAACPSTRRSRTGVAITLAGDLVYWKSKLQPSITLSTAEAEFTAASDAARVIVWLYQLSQDWCMPIRAPIELNIDNNAAISMTVANGPTTRSKHIDTRARYITEQVHRKAIEVKHVPGEYQLADIFTKPLSRVKFMRNLQLIRTGAAEPARGC